MKIWIDADACPAAIKEIIFRASLRTQTPVIVVANRAIKIPINGLVSSIQVPHGFDLADEEILKHLAPNDVVITADIPFADLAVTRGAIAVDPRGDLYSTESIKARLATRNLMSELRDAGLVTGGPKPLGTKERTAFANKLDTILAKARKR